MSFQTSLSFALVVGRAPHPVYTLAFLMTMHF